MLGGHPIRSALKPGAGSRVRVRKNCGSRSTHMRPDINRHVIRHALASLGAPSPSVFLASHPCKEAKVPHKPSRVAPLS